MVLSKSTAALTLTFIRLGNCPYLKVSPPWNAPFISFSAAYVALLQAGVGTTYVG